jgi:hypothetical protein
MLMRRYLIAAMVVLAFGASACRKAGAADAASDAVCDPAGRAGPTGYVGVGIYTPSVSWQRLVEASAPTSEQAAPNPALARKIDDQVVIVVQNSRTGDIRACGDMTGYCVGMNPWAKPPGQLTPVSLTDHQLTEAEQAAKQKQADEVEAKKQAALVAAMNRAARLRRHRG